jgi:putative ABC transport system permease protein
VLSLVGSLGALGLAHVLIRATRALGAESIPRAPNIAVDAPVLLFTAGIAVLTTVVFALAPVMRLNVAEPRRALTGEGRTITTASGTRARQRLVTAQIALAVVVVTGAGLVMRSFAELTMIDPGFRSGDVLVAELSVPAGDYPESHDVVAFYRDLVERLGHLPGTTAASVVSTLPLGGWASNIDFRIDGAAPPMPGEPAQSGDLIIADPNYLATLGVTLVEGRFFELHDHTRSLPVVVVNRRLAQMFWAGESAIGKRLRIASDTTTPWLTVIGVIDDVQYRTLADDVRPAWYLPLAQMSLSLAQPARSFHVAVRSAGDPLAVARSMHGVLRVVDANLPVIRLRPLDHVVAQSVARPRFTATVLGLFAALALALGAVGIYGVLAYGVAVRTREFGIRSALGADWRELARLVLGEGLRMTLLGLGLGLAGALAMSRLIEGLLFRISPTDPRTLAAVVVTVCLVALLASLVPLRRAIGADPLRALRAE